MPCPFTGLKMFCAGPNFLSQPKNLTAFKGQLISKCLFGVIVWTKIPTKKLPRFLPKPLRRGQIKNFIKPIMLNNP